MELAEITRQMRERLKQLKIKYNIDSTALFAEPREEHIAFNKEMLAMLNEFSKIQFCGDELYKTENKQKLIQELKSKELDFGDRTLNFIIKTYLVDIWNYFVKVDSEGNVVPNGAEKFELPSLDSDDESVERNNKYIEKKIGNIYLNKYRQLSLFILPDGTCYYAPKDHMALATWLNLNAIDIKGSLRLEVSDLNDTIDLSSLGNSMFSVSSDEDKLIEITDEQARVFASIFDAVKLTRKNNVSLEDCLFRSAGFGFSSFDYDEKYAVKNLRKIWWEFDDFDKNNYLKELMHYHEKKKPVEAGGNE